MSNKKVCVIGLGYIGLPTASLLATKGFEVHGVDINTTVVDALNRGEVTIQEPSLDILVKSAVGSGNLVASTKPVEADIFIVAVPTPFAAGHKPDLTYVKAATDSLSDVLKPGNLVILESTSPVGTTEKILEWIAAKRPDLVQEKGKPYRMSFHAAYCPERVLPGQILKELVENDRIVGGINPDSTKAAASFYGEFVSGEIFRTDSRTAEMAKLTENTFRDVNIALANELSMICGRLGLDVWELIRLANRHPRVNILKPGPGVGGHCIAVDPWFLVDAAPEEARLIRVAREVNDSKPAYVAKQVLEHLNKAGANSRAAFLGLSYKADVDDMRESPSFEVIRHVVSGSKRSHFVVEPYAQHLPEELTREDAVLTSLEKALAESNVVVLLVDHHEFREIDPTLLKGKAVVDTRGTWRKLGS